MKRQNKVRANANYRRHLLLAKAVIDALKDHYEARKVLDADGDCGLDVQMMRIRYWYFTEEKVREALGSYDAGVGA